MSNRFIVIMAGGRGERFWPESRIAKPKHLLPIVGETPMLVQTLERLGDVVPMAHVFIITNIEQKDAVLEICKVIPAENIIAEPVGRDTAAAVGLATVIIQSKDPEGTFAMLPADHVIHDHGKFKEILNASFAAAEKEDSIVTVGIKATYPATGYGYIQKGKSLYAIGENTVYAVEGFREKPDEKTAQEYIKSGKFYWNAGMFFWKVPVISKAFSEYTPSLWMALKAFTEGIKNGEDLDELLALHYPTLEKISVDYAIMEKAESVRVLESTFDWDDVGEWPAIERHFDKDEASNVARGNVIFEKASGNIVINKGVRLTAVVGVDDLIIVETEDATLVCPKGRAQEIKNLVKKIGAVEALKHLL